MDYRSLSEIYDKPQGVRPTVDYEIIEQLLENPHGGRPAQDYEITIDMTKE